MLYATQAGEEHRGCVRKVEREGGQEREASGPIRVGIQGGAALSTIFDCSYRLLREAREVEAIEGEMEETEGGESTRGRRSGVPEVDEGLSEKLRGDIAELEAEIGCPFDLVVATDGGVG